MSRVYEGTYGTENANIVQIIFYQGIHSSQPVLLILPIN